MIFSIALVIIIGHSSPLLVVAGRRRFPSLSIGNWSSTVILRQQPYNIWINNFIINRLKWMHT